MIQVAIILACCIMLLYQRGEDSILRRIALMIVIVLALATIQ